MAMTLTDQIHEVRRELKLRGQVYPRLVAADKLTQSKADRQMEALKAVLETLLAARGSEGALCPQPTPAPTAERASPPSPSQSHPSTADA